MQLWGSRSSELADSPLKPCSSRQLTLGRVSLLVSMQGWAWAVACDEVLTSRQDWNEKWLSRCQSASCSQHNAPELGAVVLPPCFSTWACLTDCFSFKIDGCVHDTI